MTGLLIAAALLTFTWAIFGTRGPMWLRDAACCVGAALVGLALIRDIA